MTAKLSDECIKQTIASVLLMTVRHVCSCLLLTCPELRARVNTHTLSSHSCTVVTIYLIETRSVLRLHSLAYDYSLSVE